MRLFAADILALLSAVAGWFYLFYSKAAGRLAGLESPSANAWRIRLRRVNGLAMFLLAIGFYAGFNAIDEQIHPGAFLLVWTGVILLLCLIMVLGLIDMRLTRKLRRSIHKS